MNTEVQILYSGEAELSLLLSFFDKMKKCLYSNDQTLRSFSVPLFAGIREVQVQFQWVSHWFQWFNLFLAFTTTQAVARRSFPLVHVVLSLLSIAVAPISYAHLAATQLGTFMKFEDMSETSSSHGGTTHSGGPPVPQLPKLQDNVSNSMFFVWSWSRLHFSPICP